MKLWNYLNGKKTLVGAVLGVVYLGSLQMGYIEPNNAIEFLIVTICGVGLGHKAVKNRSGN